MHRFKKMYQQTIEIINRDKVLALRVAHLVDIFLKCFWKFTANNSGMERNFNLTKQEMWKLGTESEIFASKSKLRALTYDTPRPAMSRNVHSLLWAEGFRSICPGQVVSLTQGPQCLVPKRTWYSFHRPN